jgi:hypothetical protein
MSTYDILLTGALLAVVVIGIPGLVQGWRTPEAVALSNDSIHSGRTFWIHPLCTLVRQTTTSGRTCR